MRILHTVAGLNESFGGPSRTVPALCDAQAKIVDLVGLASQRFVGLDSPMIFPAEAAVEVALLPAYFVRAGRLAMPLYVQGSLKRSVSKFRADIVHDHGVWQWFNHSVSEVADQLGIARVVSPRGMLMKWPMTKSIGRKTLTWRTFQRKDLERARAIVATSEEEARDVADLGITCPIAVIPNGVALPSNIARPGSGNGPYQAVFLSRLHPKKGLLNLIEAWGRVAPSHWKLIIAGPDEVGHATELRRQIDRFNLSMKVELRGVVEEDRKFEFLASCDLAILPSSSENFGMMVAESLAVGLPVIASTGTPWSGLVDYQCGWWVSNDPTNLAKAISSATSCSARQLHDMGVRGRGLAEDQYSWAAVARKTVEFYEWLLRGGVTPPFLYSARSPMSAQL